MVEANQPHDTTLTSLPQLQPAQCPFEKWEIFMSHPVLHVASVNVTSLGITHLVKTHSSYHWFHHVTDDLMEWIWLIYLFIYIQNKREK